MLVLLLPDWLLVTLTLLDSACLEDGLGSDADKLVLLVLLLLTFTTAAAFALACSD
jgi:hypothetical protein